MIKTKLAAHFLVYFQLTKIRRGLRPLHVPTSGGDQIALMHTIPKMGTELDRYDPAESENNAGSRERRGDPMFDVLISVV